MGIMPSILISVLLPKLPNEPGSGKARIALLPAASNIEASDR